MTSHSDFVFSSQCEPHIAAGRCLLANGSNPATQLADCDASHCAACGLAVNELEAAVAGAVGKLKGTEPRLEETCAGIVTQLSTLYGPKQKVVQPAIRIKRVGSYQIMSRIGRGAMGTVYRARHDGLQKDFAVKVLYARGEEGSQTVRRFQREMRALGRVHHPNVVQATDAGETDGIYFIAMEYLAGADLRVVCGERTLPAEVASEVVRQAALGVHHAHAHGLIHRDIKPSNIMLVPEDDGVTVKLLDLGLARVEIPTEDDEDLTPAGSILGTIGYMAPEQLVDPRTATPAADVYSLGVVLRKIITDSLESVTSPLLPEPLSEILDRATEADPGLRYQSALELSEALAPHATPDIRAFLRASYS